MANPNRMPNPAMMTSQPQPLQHPQYSQAPQMMQHQHAQNPPMNMPMSGIPSNQAGLTLQIPTHMSPTKEAQTPLMNTVSLCRMGQEMVHEIVQRMVEIFQLQKQLSILVNGTSVLAGMQERHRGKLEESLTQTCNQMRSLKAIYARVVQSCGGPNELNDVNCIPFEDEANGKPNNSREYQYANDELREVSEQVRMKNRQLKEIIDKLRSIVWEINTMMAMRYT